MDQPQPPTGHPEQPPPPTLTNPRFTLELEFVSSLANPYYLSHLAVTYPHLLGISNAGDEGDATKDTADPDAQAFAAYLAYLYSYWKTPEKSLRAAEKSQGIYIGGMDLGGDYPWDVNTSSFSYDMPEIPSINSFS
ncbi:unnamed protein product [Aspergillus oryzae RIB40]|uniref:Mediator of RNA polymerase II transcription subunit 31 n=1 Tax=Aspergillus oryzae (strain ATCC 42149 / RIB 40) TaxID=510516 RepID=Q2UC63_ASPOR|nr:unnamed protein product [Aspergillus oryzae RIB40]BAE60852.1 unnamed protein product [Aspergillus oryzae RIB40]